VQSAQRLKRLAQPHVVGQQAAQAGLAQELKPAHTVALVAAQLRGQVAGQLGFGQRVEALGQRTQAREVGRGRLAQLLGQARQIGHRRHGQLVVGTAGRQQVGHALADPLQPRPGKRREAPALQRNQRLTATPGAKHARGVGAARRRRLFGVAG
jgi:hypothetical protein